MAWSLNRTIPQTHTTYTNTVSMESLLGHPVTTKDEIATISEDMKVALPEDLYRMNMQWLEQMLRQFSNDTKDKPSYLHRVYCNVAQGASLYDNTRCINCCNRFTHSLFAASNTGHSFVVLERVDAGMQIEVMDFITFMERHSGDVHHIIEQSLIHHAEEAEDAAD